MLIKEASEKLGINQKRIIDTIEVDPTRVASNYEFGRSEIVDYRERVINRLLECKVDFATDANILYNFCKRYLHFTCPYCGTQMKMTTGWGCGHALTTEFVCECGSKSYITIPTEYGIRIEPKNGGKNV
jgi:hypothetical protein